MHLSKTLQATMTQAKATSNASQYRSDRKTKKRWSNWAACASTINRKSPKKQCSYTLVSRHKCILRDAHKSPMAFIAAHLRCDSTIGLIPSPTDGERWSNHCESPSKMSTHCNSKGKEANATGVHVSPDAGFGDLPPVGRERLWNAVD